MPRPTSLDEILDLFARLGDRAYEGEGVSQRVHALQCATLLEREGAAPSLIVAGLLHDLGHLWNDRGETPTARGIDDRHERVAAVRLVGMFGEEISAPIRLHVEAKRYLCAVDGGYQARLSADSVRSLALQGGPLAGEAVGAFAALPHAAAAVALRRADDLAKDPAMATPPLDHFVPMLRACALAGRLPV